MNIRNVMLIGNFQSAPDPRDPKDEKHRVSLNPVDLLWEWQADGTRPWFNEDHHIDGGRRWDGSSRPDFIGWLVPRFGVFSVASLFHDDFFETRPMLSDGTRISRKMADMLFLEIMRVEARTRVTFEPKASLQIDLAEAMYRCVRWFGEPTWDKHDEEFPA